MTPQKVGRYQIKSELGRGGMATVFHAYDPPFKRDVAVKILPREFLHDPTFRARFEREAQTIAALEHPAIVPVYDFGEEEDQPYLVMRYMPGGSLADRLNEGPLLPAEASKILQRIGSALDRAHNQGIIHRDLKPGNILFDQYDEPYLADFGIVKLIEQTTTFTGSGIIGTPAYMSPEQARGESDLDGRSDIYALGAILFEMLTGKQPYKADTPMGLAIKHIVEPVPRILEIKPDLPSGCEAVIARAMAKERTKRYSQASQLAETLHHAVTTTSVDSPTPEKTHLHQSAVASPSLPIAPMPSPSAQPRSSGWLIGGGLALIGGGLLLVIIVGAIIFFAVGGGSGDSTPGRESISQPTAAAGVGDTPTDTPTSVPSLTNTPESPTNTPISQADTPTLAPAATDTLKPPTHTPLPAPILVPTSAPLPPPTPTWTPTRGPSVQKLFLEEFNGTDLDYNKWGDYTGSGQMQVGNGVIQLKGSGQTYPFVYARQNPFPATGDFTMTVSMRYLSVTDRGVGFRIGTSQADYGTSQDRNTAELFKGRLVEIWQDTRNWHISVGDENTEVYTLPAPELQWHEITLDYRDNTYRVLLDGAEVYTSLPANQPAVLWFGNPAQVDSDGPWTDLELDNISIETVAY